MSARLLNLMGPIRDFGRFPDNYDIGLPGGNEVGIGLVIGLIAIPIGFLICKASSDKDGSVFGCLGVLLIIGGIIALLPLLAWVCALGSALYVIGIVVVAIIVILSLIFGGKK